MATSEHSSELVQHNPHLDTIVIRGRSISLIDMLNANAIADQGNLNALHRQYVAAQPFPHVVIDGLFDRTLLQCVAEEFDHEHGRYRKVSNTHEKYYRSLPYPDLGTAQAMFFNVVHSSKFVWFLEQLTGVRGLCIDSSLMYGGLHATPNMGQFGAHSDFEYHKVTGLKNRIGLITYLNENWKREHKGLLELWDRVNGVPIEEIEPIFGRTVIMEHGPRNFHAVTGPLQMPPGQSRKAVATYYYTHDGMESAEFRRNNSVFLDQIKHRGDDLSPWLQAFSSLTWKGRMVLIARQVTPPVLWPLVRRACEKAESLTRELKR